MPKLKTSKTAAKRIVNIKKRGNSITINTRRMSAQHLATNKNSRSTHAAAHKIKLAKGDAKKIARMVPYL